MTEQELEKEARDITDGKRVEQFVADPAVKNAISRLNEQYYAEFKNAATETARSDAWAKSRALDDLSGALIAVVQNGKREEHNQNMREAYANRNGRKR